MEQRIFIDVSLLVKPNLWEAYSQYSLSSRQYNSSVENSLLSCKLGRRLAEADDEGSGESQRLDGSARRRPIGVH
jgi:hypothetical protein